MILKAAATILILVALNLSAQANNYPCAKSRGGVDHCNGETFVCRDGSESSSTQKCLPASLNDFRSQWDFDHAKSPSSESSKQQGSITPAPVPPMSAPIMTATARVIDGDTLSLAGETFRLEGIDAPEMKQRCLDASGTEYPCGRRAKEALAAMIKGPVSCTVTGHDKYGRSLGYCASGAIDLNRQMVVTGYAMAFVKYVDLH